jgi:ATP-dependent exoDNAse (exonuclease V) beta subunit
MSNFVVYKSSAGSGKTFTLVKEYLRLALADDKKIGYGYKHILAVTFTNKAAAEMKQRVISALDQISNSEFVPFIGELIAKELNISTSELKKRSRYLLSSILHNYSDFSIGTIDSFTHKIVKTFAFDLNLPVNFNLETDVEGFYGKVVSELLGKIGEDDYVTKLLKDYSLNKAEDNSSWDPESNILEFVKLLQKENADDYLQKLNKFNAGELEEFRKQFLQFTGAYSHFLKGKAKEALDCIKKYSLGPADFWHGQKGPVNFFSKCFENEVTLDEANANRLSEAVSKIKWLKDNSYPDAELISQKLNETALILIGYINQNYRHFVLCQLLNKQIYQLMLIKKIEEISQNKKTEEQIVFISEFNQKIFELINNEPTPFIYERLGERYHHYLLDEFQDTSGLQWQNILPLLDNSLANGWFNLIVGDGKQSIYRWRNANVKQFANLPNVENTAGSFIVEERIDSLKRNFLEKTLSSNYRSVKTVVEFNNSLFESLSNNLLNGDFSSIYKNQVQLVENNNIGYISVNTGKTERDKLDSFNCDQIKIQILAALKSGFSYNDISVISRTNYQGNIIANYLVEEKIPVVSSDSLLLKNNLEVNTLLCFLNYLNNNEDNVSAAGILNYLYQSKQISNQQFNDSVKKISGKDSLFRILNGLGIAIQKEDFLLKNLLDNCILIVSSLGLAKSNHLYIRFFLDEINEFLVTKNSNLLQFTQWWESRLKKASVIIQENSDAVKIMTIHACKGLEFPVVIVPFCNWPQYRIGDSWVNINDSQLELPVAVVSLSEKVKDAGLEKELEKEKQEQTLDNLNLLYVVFTRAAERLHIISTSSSSNTQKSINTWIEDYLMDVYGQKPDNFYEVGEKKPPLKGHKKQMPRHYDLKPLEFSTNNNSVKIKSSYFKNSSESEKAKKQGILLHWILSKIKTAADIDNALNEAVIEGNILSSELESFKAKITSFLGHPRLKTYFAADAEGKLEKELITVTGEILRPDRIVFLKDLTVIIDYKTGEENNKKYFPQMLSYENALKEMGYPNIKKILAYIDTGEVVEF